MAILRANLRRIPHCVALALVLSLFILAAGPALAQTSGATLTGRVTDESGAPLPGVSITAKAQGTGFERTAVTESDGAFRFPALPVGDYDLRAALKGFRTVEQKGVALYVATTRSVDFRLAMAPVAASITVSSEAPVIRSEPAIGAVVSKDELENLPLNGRQFANLAALAPGTTLAYNSDPTKPGQLTIALNGGIGRNVNFTMDGGDNTDDTIGGALQNFSLESVQEFNIQTMQYKAEYGRSSGGVLSVVTKSGTNAFKGGAFLYFRDKSLNARTESEKLAGSDAQDYRRYQYGASIGGPIVEDKVHFFGVYEKTKRDTNYTVDTGGLYPSLDGTATPLAFNDELASGKVTADISAKQFLQVRFGYQKNTDKYGASPLATPDSLGTVTNKYSTILASHTASLGSSQVNEFLFQYSKFDNAITPDSKNAQIAYPSGAHSGENINTPQTTQQVKYQFKDDFSFSKEIAGQRHDFKVGFNIIHEPTLGGDFSTGVDAPQFSLKEDRVGSPVVDITQYGGFFQDQTPVNEYSVYIQDDWRPSSRLTVNVGLRYDYWAGFDLDQRSNPIWKVLSTQTKYNEYYLKDFQNGGGGVLSNDKKNFAPRLGFSWDATGKSKTFVRGGWGIYYDFPYSNATILFPAAAVQSNYGVAYNYNNPAGIRNPDGSYFQPGQPLPPNQLSGIAVNPPNEVASPTLKTPFSRQGSIGISHQVTDWLGANLEYVNIAYRDIPFRFRANPTTGAGQPRRFPDFGNFRIWYGGGFADFNGMNLSLTAKLSSRLTVQGFYTLSRVTGNVLSGADEFRLTDLNYQPDLRRGRDVSVNPLDPLCDACTGPLNTDARHRVTIGATYRAPYGFTVAGMLRYRSATPYLIHAGQDLNGDGFVIDLPPGVSHVNAGRGSSFSQADLRLSKEFSLAGTVVFEVMADIFNVFNSKNPAGYRGDMSSASTFGQPSTYAGDPLQGEQRLVQLGARVRF